MTDRPEHPHEASERGDTLAPLLGNVTVWSDPDATLEDGIIAAVVAEQPPMPASRPIPWPGAIRRWLGPVAVGVAAAIVVLIAASVVDGDADRGTTGVAVVLAGTELAPASSAVATVADTPLGTRIDLDVSGLAPAGQDEYYEAWMWNDDGDAVSAGSFHLRGGDGSIELWAGVGLADYPRITVTRQRESDGVEPSGEVVLRSG